MKPVLRQTIRLLWAGLATLCLLLFSIPAAAQTPPASSPQTWTLDELQERQSVVNQYREQLNQQKQQLQQREGQAIEELGSLQQNQLQASQNIQNREAQQKIAQAELETIQNELVQIETQYHQQREETANRLRFLQKNIDNQNWSTLLQSKSLEDLLDKRYHLKRLYAADRQSLNRLKTEADRVNTQKVAIEKKKNEIALILQQLYTDREQFGLKAKAQRDLILRLNTDLRAIEAAETQLENDSKNISAFIQQRVAVRSAYGNQAPPVLGTGQMILPAQGSVTSPFGWRTHPISGNRRFHGGLDVGAPEGTPIVAADSGTVIVSEWYGGYGNAVIIDHGNDITTLYAHCSELYVSEGDTIQKGQLIAAVGSTGYSTGPHLHFEVRIKGEPSDPVAFL